MSSRRRIRSEPREPARQTAVLTTPDGRYIVVRERLWRAANPNLPARTRKRLVRELMEARRAVKAALRSKDTFGLRTARLAVDGAKVALGERGPPWWNDGTKDFNRHLVKNSPYAEWFSKRKENGRRRRVEESRRRPR